MGWLSLLLGGVDLIRQRFGQRPLLQAIAQGPLPSGAQGAPAMQPPPSYYQPRPSMPFGAPTPYGPQFGMPQQYAPMGGYPQYAGAPMSAPMQYGGPGSLYNMFRAPSYPYSSRPLSYQSPFASPSQSYGLAPYAMSAPAPYAGSLPQSMAAPQYGAPSLPPIGPGSPSIGTDIGF